MGVMPDKKVEKLGFCEAHVAPWTTNAVAMGSTVLAVTDFSTKTTTARTAYTAKQAAEEAVRNANADFDIALLAATTAAADIISRCAPKRRRAGMGFTPSHRCRFRRRRDRSALRARPKRSRSRSIPTARSR
jgi:hypothetical protein